jgi:protein SCO1/2
MRRLGAVTLLFTLVGNLLGDVVDVAPERGRAVPSIKWTDETGRARQLSEFAGYPVILLPIYTHCRTACVQNVSHLKGALAESAGNIAESRVLLFSFDADETPTTLAKFREREKVPLGWSIGAASQTEIDALLESIGVQVGRAGTEFAHPNIVVFLDSNLRVVKWIYGTDYTKSDVDLALQVAMGRSDWIGRHSDVLYAFLLFGASILCVAVAYYLRLYLRRAFSPVSV